MEQKNINGLQVAHNMTFDIEPLGGKDVDSVLELGCNVLRELGATWWLSAGTMLGLYRDGGHIPHDTDIDIGILADKDLRIHYETWPPLFRKHGFKFVRSMHYETQPMQMAFVHSESNILFDLYFFYKNTRKAPIMYNINEHGIMKKPLSFFEPLGSFEHSGVNYFAPNDIESYLEMRYGNDWMTPKTSKESWETDAANLFGVGE